jgi:hypothetical protein
MRSFYLSDRNVIGLRETIAAVQVRSYSSHHWLGATPVIHQSVFSTPQAPQQTYQSAGTEPFVFLAVRGFVVDYAWLGRDALWLPKINASEIPLISRLEILGFTTLLMFVSSS